MSARIDPVKQAIEIFLKIKQEVRDNSSLGSRLRARAREMPELMESIGLISTLSFCYAKKNGEGEEARSYELFLKALLLHLRELGFLNKDVEEALNKPAETLNELYPKAGTVMPFLRPFLIEFKRLCEAEWRSTK